MTDLERKVFSAYDAQEPDDYGWEQDDCADEEYEMFMAEAEMVRAEREL